MKVMFLCILSLFLLEIAKASTREDFFFPHTFLEIDLTSKPRLQYLCLRKLDPLSLGFSYLQEEGSEVNNIGSSNDFNATGKLFISNVSYLALEQHLLNLSENPVQNELSNNSFLVDKDEAIAEFLFNYFNEQESLLFANKFEDEKESNKLNSANQSLKKEKKSKFDYSVFIWVVLAGLIVYFAFYQSPSVISKSATRRLHAQRMRWLKHLHTSGRVETANYNFLLSHVDDLPRLIREKEFAHLDLPTTGADPALEVALRRRKRGESVVSTKETSLERTSR
jgi:hypothetical protein